MLLDVDELGIAVLRVNRPAARNALDWLAQEQFAAAIAQVAAAEQVRVLIITGSGERAFVSGGDLKQLSEDPRQASGERLNRVMTRALTQLTQLPLPVIGAVNGDAFGGGCEIITACDLRIAAAHARFSFAQVRNALTTGWGGTGRLVRLLGQSRALDLLLTARTFDAAEAVSLGLVHRIVAADEPVLDAARAWAQELAALPKEALAAAKALTYAAAQLEPDELLQYERRLFLDLWATPDHLEALTAFREKRAPQFNQGELPQA